MSLTETFKEFLKVLEILKNVENIEIFPSLEPQENFSIKYENS
jgi:hypothetical protein